MTTDELISQTTGAEHRCEITLFVSGASPRSTAAIAAVRSALDDALEAGARLHVVDASADPTSAREHEVVVLPTLVASCPGPRRHLVLDLTDPERVRSWFDQVSGLHAAGSSGGAG